MRSLLRDFGMALSLGPILVLLSCSGDDLVSPTTGSIAITTSTTGTEPDPDGFAISVNDGAEIAIGANGSHQVNDLPAGSHLVRLGGMAANCTIEGENPRAVSVEAGATATVQFNVTCGPTTGSLTITTSTSGTSPDPDGYTITLDGTDHGALGVNNTVTLDGIAAGDHAVGLSGVTGNCQVQGDNPRTVTLTAGASAAAAFAINCAAPPANAGSLRIITSTTGADPDPDGYAFTVDGGSSQPIGISAMATLANVAAGSRSVRLSGLAGNCSVQGTNPRSATVSTGATTDVSFAITCTAANGIIEITTTTTGGSSDPDGYTVAVDNGMAQPIGTNATVMISNVAPGPHQVTLAGVATNCTVAAENPRPVTVTAAGTAAVSFSVGCNTPPSSSKIAFNTWDGGTAAIYVANPDGTGLTKLTPGAEDDRRPLWSPDRSKLAFVRNIVELWVMSSDGSNRVRLTNRLADGISDFRWSPDGSMIAFERNDAMVECQLGGVPSMCPLAQIWTVRPDGSDVRKVVDGSDPSWAPDGRRIAFTADDQIQVVNADGTGGQTLTNEPGGAFQPVWSPAGGRIAFVTVVERAGEVTEILVMNEDGTQVSNLTSDRGADSEPLWSPDGSKIAFNTFDPMLEGTNVEVAVMNPDGSGRTLLTSNPASDRAATWAPEGDRLAFMREAFGEPSAIDVYVVNVDGSAERNLTNNPAITDDWPSWSSD
jgi:Tol biopolymer transport system component